MTGKKTGVIAFWHKHPVLMNFLSIIVASVLLVWLVGVVFLNYWTRHGDEIAMPEVKSLNVSDARRILLDAEFEVQLDSVFNNDAAPGTVLRQVPRENSMVKRGGRAYLQYVCYSVKRSKVPEFVDGSLSNAMNNFRAAGFENIEVQEVTSEQDDLVLGATYNGLDLRPGMEIPVNAHIVIKVSVNPTPEIDYGDINPEDADAEFIESIFEDDFGYEE